MAKATTSILMPFAKVTPIAPSNKGFTLVKIWVCAHGKNRNMSHISKEELDSAIPSLAYIPVVGHLMEKVNENGDTVGYLFGGHDVELTENWTLRPLTVPYGVVTADAPSYETVMEYGKEREYLTAHAYLWTERYPEILEATYSDEVWFGESMEITYGNYDILEEDSNYVDLHDLEFSALCILGKSDDPSEHTEPCFLSSRIEPVTFNLQTEQFNQLVAEMRTQLSHCFVTNDAKEGGNESLNQELITAIFAEMGIDMNTIDFEITADMTEEQLRAALSAFAETQNAGDPAEEPAPEEDDSPNPEEPTAEDPAEEDPADDPAGEEPAEDVAEPEENGEDAEFSVVTFSATANQKKSALENALDPVVARDADGNIISEITYWVEDFDDTHCFVVRHKWARDDYEHKFGRFPYAFDETAKTATITGAFEEMVQMWLTLDESARLESERAELEQLRIFKSVAERAALNAQIEELKSEFEDVSHLDEFAAVFENAEDLEDMRMRLFALRGKQVKVKKSQKSEPVVKFELGTPNSDCGDHYGGVFAKYGPRAKR